MQLGISPDQGDNSGMDDIDHSDDEPIDPMDQDQNAAPAVTQTPGMIDGIRIALAGRLGSMNRREATNLLRSFGATIVDAHQDAIHWVVIGADESPLTQHELLPASLRDAVGKGDTELIAEADLWQRLGLVETDTVGRQYYTPMMLADLLDIPLHVIRRWQRRGLIRPVRTMHRLPYFDFQEVATAKRLAQWIDAGASPKAIEQRLVDLIEVLPDIQRPLDQLSILVEGKQVLLRGGEGLIETGGQMRFDFDACEPSESETVDDDVVFPIESWEGPLAHADALASDDELLVAAFEADDRDDLETAIDCCHAILARDGPRADICFQLGEWLYRMNEPVAARERFYMAIELDPELVEARACLGMVLAELGQDELAIAAFRGVLSLHPDYPDAHYHVANLLADSGRDIEAEQHWKRFLHLSPESPWAGEARRRLKESQPEFDVDIESGAEQDEPAISVVRHDDP
ncbi:MerR family transcriptional regulator [Crateriforma conspicua]|uniref:Tetratricopeptide repeat protein n=1 Tax=Crateriforma conspicua TaxID=2527996 RepID=A0A5C5Y578_9PLAN|nr:MerR family transcriptional regulator [Crateriforma conspicua]TWT69791.1 Tetratricopeptide repeat protein [Crateriforma conspicua]